MLGDWGGVQPTDDRPGGKAGLLYVSDIAQDGALLGVYNSYAAAGPAELVLVNPPESRHVTRQFRYQLEWTVAGIFVAGEHYLSTSPHL